TPCSGETPAISPSKRPRPLRFARLSEHATAPTRGSPRAAGYGTCTRSLLGVMEDQAWLAKHFIDVGAGVIDEDYRGNVGGVLFNFGKEKFEVKKCDRIAQLICERIFYPEIEEVQALDDTERGSGGFGSTGKD
uniref:Deoxyuridine 5'-triphosphate nucleotidohydrolase n=1 Tax=Macaca nemestrina TaxID=9545 RepID=A0A2K6BBA4_MACNE